MASWWTVLGVDAGTDLRAVKRAYAAKLKSIRQDQDPKGFMELRAAYEAARANICYQEQTKQHTDSGDEGVIEVDPDWEAQAGDITDVSPEVNYPTTVQQLIDEVLALIGSPWAAGNLDSWRGVLEDERLDDIDVFADFENALLNLLLNMHGFFEEEKNIPPKLDVAVAHLIFERFGWNENRNSVHYNPVVFDWLTDKLFRQHEDATYGDLEKINLGSTPAYNDYSQHNQRRLIKKPRPRTDKFLKWFDGSGKLIMFVAAIVLMGVYYIFSGAANVSWETIYQESIIANQAENNSPDYFEMQKLITQGNSIENISYVDCERLEAWAKNYSMAINFGERPLDLPSTLEPILPATDPMEVFKNMEGMNLEDRPQNALDEALEKIWQDIESAKTDGSETQINPSANSLEERFNTSRKTPVIKRPANLPWLRAKCRAEKQRKAGE